MRVVFQQADLDTCLTALVCGVQASDDIRVVTGEASGMDLADPDVLCIEAGGAGQTRLRNFDHHGVGAPQESACVQALREVAEPSEHLRRLVAYVAEVDRGRLGAAPLVTEHVMTLSSVFSGMRLSTEDPTQQFLRGLAMLGEILRRDFNPAGPIPELPEWSEYFGRKREEWAGIDEARSRIEAFTTASGKRAGFVETEFVGALGLLYEEGCDIGIAYSPQFRSPSGAGLIPKYSIGCRQGGRVDGLLPHLNSLEGGWGGPSHGTIIGSPRTGSALSPDVVKAVVTTHS